MKIRAIFLRSTLFPFSLLTSSQQFCPASSFVLPTSSSFSIKKSLQFSSPRRMASSSSSSSAQQYSIPDQPARVAAARNNENETAERMMDIDSAYDPSYLKPGLRVAVTGANRGIGLSLCAELAKFDGVKIIALVRKSSDELAALNPDEIIEGCDVTSEDACKAMAKKIKNGPIDILINNAGYFYEPEESIDSLNFSEELKMIDICALGPLRVTSALYNGGLLKKTDDDDESGQKCSRVAIISSQGGSIEWRFTQNPEGKDYGHHMSKAAANMAGILLSQELKSKGIAVSLLHPGFNKTEMTKKYEKIWEVEGAVDATVGAKRVLHEVGRISLENNGKFINCEDGLEIPF